MRSWEADEEVAELLDLAVQTTGASLRDIVNEAIREYAPGIILRLLDQRGEAERRLRALLQEKYGLRDSDTREGAQAFSTTSAESASRRRRIRKG